jgi:probable phosphoglycerate mutase
MHWGEWEGFTIEDLRERMGAVMREREAKGLDFRAPGGESPRDVQGRLGPWLAELADAQEPTIAVAHKGVIRALYALATGWDMRAREPVTIDWTAAQLFHLDAKGGVTVARLNVTLAVDTKVAP